MAHLPGLQELRLPYSQFHVRDLGLPAFANRLIPLMEVAYSSPASSPSKLGTQVVVAPDVIYEGDSFQVSVEALIPANRTSGRSVGVITQLHLFLDDLFPNSLGKPLLGERSGGEKSGVNPMAPSRAASPRSTYVEHCDKNTETMDGRRTRPQ